MSVVIVVIAKFKKGILSCPNVTAEPYSFRCIESRLNKREM
jgi:hypothetical protein